MKFSYSKVVFVFSYLSLFNPPLFAQTELVSSVFTTAGGNTQTPTGSINLTATVGEFSPPGLATNGVDSLFSGFINTIEESDPPPVIQHTPVTGGSEGQAVSVEATVTDNSDVANVDLNYRQGGQSDSQYLSAPLTLSNANLWQGSIPSSSVGNRGVEYFIEATDDNGNKARTPGDFFAVSIDVNEIQKDDRQPTASSTNDYRIISIPLKITNNSPTSVFSNFGQNGSGWRLWAIDGNAGPDMNRPYVEFANSNFAIEQGKGYWLIVKDSGNINSGRGTTENTSTGEDFLINLNQGWNFVSNPFNFNIPISNVRLQSSNDLPSLGDVYSYNGSEFVPFDSNATMKPFEGYAWFSGNQEQILITARENAVTGSVNKNSALMTSDEHTWTVQITAQSGSALDTYNFAGVASGASEEWDEFDRAEPLVIGEYISVYFPHPEWNEFSSTYRTDIRPQFKDGYIWEIEVQSNIRDQIDLTFGNIEQVPVALDIFLIDETLSIRRNLRRDPAFSFVGAGEKSPKRLKLLVGRSKFLDEQVEEDLFTPSSFLLEQNYPNPFNPSTTIHYGLPKDGQVSLTIFNLLGETIVTLVDDEYQHEGYHTVIWDGRDELGKVVASGIYVYRMQVGGFLLTKKLAFIK